MEERPGERERAEPREPEAGRGARGRQARGESERDPGGPTNGGPGTGPGAIPGSSVGGPVGGPVGGLGKALEEHYSWVHRVAVRYMARQPAHHTLSATALVNEVYLKVAQGAGGPTEGQLGDRDHLTAYIARTMRSILVDHARKRRRLKHAPQGDRIDLDHLIADDLGAPLRTLDVDRALGKLAKVDPEGVTLIELRYFGGLSVAETAKAIGKSQRTTERELSVTKAWLRGEIT